MTSVTSGARGPEVVIRPVERKTGSRHHETGSRHRRPVERSCASPSGAGTCGAAVGQRRTAGITPIPPHLDVSQEGDRSRPGEERILVPGTAPHKGVPLHSHPPKEMRRRETLSSPCLCRDRKNTGEGCRGRDI
ncbi:hypothetical protein GDO81_020959 [Engystomops pustulosus]|uniref:Uncharacterized protein n=1 Tax=Engystomops pustulosus TaxID=76066 RepID=A0AAV6YPQ5_ENGPU|nr:hypothetical protein GDO81_020959 [Engystomops pustulosus]